MIIPDYHNPSKQYLPVISTLTVYYNPWSLSYTCQHHQIFIVNQLPNINISSILCPKQTQKIKYYFVSCPIFISPSNRCFKPAQKSCCCHYQNMSLICCSKWTFLIACDPRKMASLSSPKFIHCSTCLLLLLFTLPNYSLTAPKPPNFRLCKKLVAAKIWTTLPAAATTAPVKFSSVHEIRADP